MLVTRTPSQVKNRTIWPIQSWPYLQSDQIMFYSFQVAGIFQDPSIGEIKITYVVKRITVLNSVQVSTRFGDALFSQRRIVSYINGSMQPTA